MTPKVVRDLEYPGFKGKVNLFCKTEGEEFGERGRALQLRGKAEREGMVEDFLVCKGIDQKVGEGENLPASFPAIRGSSGAGQQLP